jgi:hypothetical protein
MIISCYGVHWAPGDIPFLVQALGSQNLISPDLESPFTTNIWPRRQRCPHQIDLTITAEADWIADPLAQALLPVPRLPGEKAKAIVDPDRRLERLLMQLQRMSTPTEPLLRPIYWRLAREMRGLYAVSNLSPLIWFGAELQHTNEVMKHILEAEGASRHILIVCQTELPVYMGVDWIKTELTDVGSEPLEAIGAGVLRKNMEAGR